MGSPSGPFRRREDVYRGRTAATPLDVSRRIPRSQLGEEHRQASFVAPLPTFPGTSNLLPQVLPDYFRLVLLSHEETPFKHSRPHAAIDAEAAPVVEVPPLDVPT